MKKTILQYKTENNAATLKAELTLKSTGPLAADVVKATDDFVNWMGNPEKDQPTYQQTVEVGKAVVRADNPAVSLDAPYSFGFDGLSVPFEVQSALFNLAQTRQYVSVRLVVLPVESPIETEDPTEIEPQDEGNEAPESPETPQAIPLSPEETALYEAVTQFEHDSVMAKIRSYQKYGSTQANIIKWLANEFDDAGENGTYHFVGMGKLNWLISTRNGEPRIWIGKTPGASVSPNGKPTWKGAALADMVRKLFQIPEPTENTEEF